MCAPFHAHLWILICRARGIRIAEYVWHTRLHRCQQGEGLGFIGDRLHLAAAITFNASGMGGNRGGVCERAYQGCTSPLQDLHLQVVHVCDVNEGAQDGEGHRPPSVDAGVHIVVGHTPQSYPQWLQQKWHAGEFLGSVINPAGGPKSGRLRRAIGLR